MVVGIRGPSGDRVGMLDVSNRVRRGYLQWNLQGEGRETRERRSRLWRPRRNLREEFRDRVVRGKGDPGRGSTIGRNVDESESVVSTRLDSPVICLN